MVIRRVRRVNLTDRSKDSLLDYIEPRKYFLLPNTAAATRPRSVRTRAWAGKWALQLGKLEVIGDQQTLFPDTGAGESHHST